MSKNIVPAREDWAERQYDAFAERRRLEAEQVAEARYLEDLRRTAETLDSAKQAPKRRKKGKRE